MAIGSLRSELLGVSKLFDKMLDAIIVMDVETGRIAFWNLAAEAMFGFPAAEAIGRPVEIIIPEYMRPCHQAGLAGYRETGHGALIDGGQPMEVQACHRSGATICIELTLSKLEGEPLAQRYVMAILRDITQRRRTEQKLVKEEARLAEAQHLAHLGSWEWDITTNLITWSDELFQIFGLTSQAFGGTFEAYMERVHPEDRAFVKGIIDRARSDQQPYSYFARIVRPDGTIRVVQSRGAIAETGDHDVVKFMGTVQDVTEQKRLEEKLREGEQRYRLLAENATDIISRHAPNGGCLYISPACRRILGYAPEELIGRQLVAFVHPDDRDRLLKGRDAALSAPGEHFRLAFRLKHKDGAYVWLEATFKAIQDQVTGNVSELAMVSRDVTERMRMEAALKDSERKFRSIFEAAYQFIGLLTPDGRVVDVNQSPLDATGVRREDVIGRPFWETHWWNFSPEVQSHLRQDIVQAAQGGFIHREVENRGTGDTILIVDYSLKPVRNEAGQIVWLMAEGRDITERKLLEETLHSQYEQLKELDRLKGDFVNAVSHDLRTPLTSIMGYAEFLEDGLGGELSTQQLEFVGEIEKSAMRLEGMVNDLLDVARIEAGTFKLDREPTDLSEKVRETVLSLSPQLSAAGLDMELSLPEVPLIANLDSARIERVVFNFLSNAIKFTPEGGHLRVRARAEGDQLCCEVEDTGIGISAEDLPKLFRRFSQLENGRKKAGGTGLGLSISKSIVEAHGGTIGVRSEPGKGSTFWFCIPLTNAGGEA